MRSQETLGALIDLLPTDDRQGWIDVACGPGLVARALAPRVGAVVGVDLTEAMVELGAAEAAREGVGNLRFVRGDVARLPFRDATFDGAVTRFSFHHIPLPGRCLEEMARVVRPGGWVAVSDHLTTEDADGAAWHQEIERLRDPSHWACLTPARFRALGDRVGLTLEQERIAPFRSGLEQWIARGTGGFDARPLIEHALSGRPQGTDAWAVEPTGGEPQLRTTQGIWLWRR